jgi:hypothetical protein
MNLYTGSALQFYNAILTQPDSVKAFKHQQFYYCTANIPLNVQYVCYRAGWKIKYFNDFIYCRNKEKTQNEKHSSTKTLKEKMYQKYYI